MLEIHDLTAGPAGPPILQGLSLEIRAGGRTAVLGPSGVGKTTLLRAISGLLRPRHGRIRIDGREVFGPHSDVAPAERGVAMVFQNYALWPHLTVDEHVRLVQGGEAVPDWLERVGLGGLRERLPGQLSGGEQARLSLARALASQPQLLLLDEPFRNLDPALARDLRTEVREWFVDTALSVLLVTHDPEEAEQLVEQFCVLGPAGIVAHDTPEALRKRPGSLQVAQIFGRAELLPGERCGESEMRTALGTLAVQGEADSNHILLRPEDLRVEACKDGEAEVLASFLEQGRKLLRLEWRKQILHALAEPGSNSDSLTVGTRVRPEFRRPLAALRAIPQEPIS